MEFENIFIDIFIHTYLNLNNQTMLIRTNMRGDYYTVDYIIQENQLVGISMGGITNEIMMSDIVGFRVV